jgi:hypothetical protein
LKQGEALARQEPETHTWYAVQLDAQTFDIFDTFATDVGQQAHLNGPIAAALMANAEALLTEANAEALLTEANAEALLAEAPEINFTDVLAVK